MAAQPNLRAQFPSGPLLDGGELTPVWRAYFASLYARTGGAPGASADGVQSNLDAEIAARQAGDVALSGAVVTERGERQAADTAEATARAAADTAEATARAAADALLLPKTGGTLSGAVTAPAATLGSLRFSTVPVNAANDAAAATAGVAVGGVYRNGSVLMVRVV